jgi:CIC family chloride channel protein
MHKDKHANSIPVSPILTSLQEDVNYVSFKKGRLIQISAYAVVVSIAISFIAKVLVLLINLVTNISFYGSFNAGFRSPAGNHLGAWVIIVPAIGGLVVGLMALYGSKAIRGHGIPEAMEQILVNQSKIKPSITFLKPLSSAIAIGTGGPFGAEGPIIATGGALGSTLGQLLKITSSERKVILAAGATAGMSAIFGTPIAAVFLAIELLLFEFSPRAILPVALACITGAAGHHLLFEAGPVFTMPNLQTPSNLALAVYSFIGLLIGLLSVVLTKAVYLVEDLFEKLPIHWMWWPALGGLAVGLTGYFYPHTLGVGYDNITSLLSGRLPLALIVSLCFFKFVSWAIALGSGTSGGTLAPLLTIGGAAGAVISTVLLKLFPGIGINVPMGALIGMSAMFAGASRAYLTSVTFALEATMQSHALLPLLGACTASYIVSFFMMENTIMTEKIARRGVFTPDSYEPDVLQKITVAEVMSQETNGVNIDWSIQKLKEWLAGNPVKDNAVIIVNHRKEYQGIVSLNDIYTKPDGGNLKVKDLLQKQSTAVKANDTLRSAVGLMAQQELEVMPVLAGGLVVGVLGYANIISGYKQNIHDNETRAKHISLRRQRMKVVLKGKQLLKKQSTND